MKNRTFFSTFLLFLLSIYVGILLLSIATLRDTTKQARERCMEEHRFITSMLIDDLSSLENRDIHMEAALPTLLHPYSSILKNQKSKLTAYQEGRFFYATETNGFPDMDAPAVAEGERLVSMQEADGRYFVCIFEKLPQPYGDYLILYQSDMTAGVAAWRHRKNTMLLTGGILSFVLALFQLLLLERLFRPLAQITALSQKIAAGDYAIRLPENGKNEVLQMARSFNYMAEEIQHQVAVLALAAENKQRFIDNFAHELRTPLTAVYGYAEYMQKAAVQEEDRQFALRCILEESSRMQAMANQLLELAELRNDQVQMEMQRLPELFEGVRQTLFQALADKQIQLTWACDVSSVCGDRVLLHSLLVNLIENGIKASEDGGAIAVQATMEKGDTVITVRDCGKGMAEEELAHITDPYYRVDRSRNRREGGAGLGLAICRQIVERHGATLTFSSAPGVGTTAAITFTSP